MLTPVLFQEYFEFADSSNTYITHANEQFSMKKTEVSEPPPRAPGRQIKTTFVNFDQTSAVTTVSRIRIFFFSSWIQHQTIFNVSSLFQF